MTDPTTPQSAPPPPPPSGWYDDGHGMQRWWDGTTWTQYAQPLTPAAPPHPHILPTSAYQPSPANKNFWGWNPPIGINPTAPYSGIAIVGFTLVMGAILFAFIRGLDLLAVPLNIAGIIVSYQAMKQIRRTGTRGYNLAFAGYLTGALAVLLPLVLVIFALLFLAVYHAV